MELPNTEAMSIEEKIWFARAIAGMIVADGRVDDSELEFLKEAISFLEDRDQVNGIMARSQGPDDMGIIILQGIGYSSPFLGIPHDNTAIGTSREDMITLN